MLQFMRRGFKAKKRLFRPPFSLKYRAQTNLIPIEQKAFYLFSIPL